jgi:hypothetical protein
LKSPDLRYQGAMNEDEHIDEAKSVVTAEAGAALKPAKPDLSESDRRRARAAAKLKENLSRRKQQVRARRAGEADDTDGLPAAKEMDGSPAAKMDEL